MYVTSAEINRSSLCYPSLKDLKKLLKRYIYEYTYINFRHFHVGIIILLHPLTRKALKIWSILVHLRIEPHLEVELNIKMTKLFQLKVYHLPKA